MGAHHYGRPKDARGMPIGRGVWKTGEKPGNSSVDADVSAWLEMHNAGMLLIDRKGGAAITHVTHAAVSITGGIQPSVLRAALSSELFENGLAARLLLAMPTPPPRFRE